MWEQMINNQTNNPFSFENLQKLSQYNQVNNFNIVNQDKYAELQNKIQSLSTDEKNYLLSNQDFVISNNQYEQGLFNFIGNQFRTQYNNTPEAQKLLSNLEESLNKTLKQVQSTLEQERQEMRELKELLKNNPDILKNLKSNE